MGSCEKRGEQNWLSVFSFPWKADMLFVLLLFAHVLQSSRSLSSVLLLQTVLVKFTSLMQVRGQESCLNREIEGWKDDIVVPYVAIGVMFQVNLTE